jgi:hypothetical protein
MVRWDRVSRVAMLAALFLLLYLAISPVRTLLGEMHLSSERQAQLQTLRHQAAVLTATEHALQSSATSDVEARNLGLVAPGEHEYIVNGLPNN